ncbi:uncharacterized protein LOC131597928 [Vicia villosa]|uniref:uncharacterized protein LOC131597928 n=1 Tax=Vicia villosa TaxID=3911 RepID=UPI00273C474D|nr:uncharacterized protein LOC131597928 [Vicia villosa]
MGLSWMKADRLGPVYEKGVLEFLEYADKHLPDNNGIFYCPCVVCVNINKGTKKEIFQHLCCDGICQNYITWMWHGEVDKEESRAPQSQRVDEEEYMEDELEDMFRDIGESSFKNAHIYDTLYSDKDTPLYKRCTNFTRLSAVLKLFNLKAKNGWSDKSFTELLELVNQMLPEDNKFSDCCYEAKKILCTIGMEYIKIHACPNNFILYRKECEDLFQCMKYGLSHYKLNANNGDDNDYDNILFANSNDTKNLRWHADEMTHGGNIRHVADLLQWKKIDSLFSDFGVEPRNLRLGLATDEMNPFGYLSPLIDDLRLLWDEGVEVDDAYYGEKFKMDAMLFFTINDFPTYGNLAEYSVKEHKACPIFEYDTCYHQHESGKKTVYLGHQKFLKPGHPYRRLRKVFNGEQEFDEAPEPLTGDKIYQQQEHINVVFGKREKEKWAIAKNIWKKRFIFFDLPYWSSLDVRHCLDVMHVKKMCVIV